MDSRTRPLLGAYETECCDPKRRTRPASASAMPSSELLTALWPDARHGGAFHRAARHRQDHAGAARARGARYGDGPERRVLVAEPLPDGGARGCPAGWPGCSARRSAGPSASRCAVDRRVRALDPRRGGDPRVSCCSGCNATPSSRAWTWSVCSTSATSGTWTPTPRPGVVPGGRAAAALRPELKLIAAIGDERSRRPGRSSSRSWTAAGPRRSCGARARGTDTRSGSRLPPPGSGLRTAPGWTPALLRHVAGGDGPAGDGSSGT
ncbi:hypothetical protein SNARM312S_08313 [Streptomyces narbonensis]